MVMLLLVFWIKVDFNRVVKLQATFALDGILIAPVSHGEIQAQQVGLGVSYRLAESLSGCVWLEQRLLIDNSLGVNIAFRVLIYFFVEVTVGGLESQHLVVDE